MIKKITLLVLIVLSVLYHLRADEGMWIPTLLDKYNISEMQSKGFKLTAEDIYSINKASMKDAVVMFGGGCTGALISDSGLLITNHHCGYGLIHSHSSLDNDYLTDGFWAMTQEEELTNPRLTVTFLVRMEDVTEKVFADIQDEMNEAERQNIIDEEISKIEKQAVEGTHYVAKIIPFYYGNEYYLFVSEIFKDVRLVGAPPSAIGKFGGDTDNWMWPRHTGDFALFRIYAAQDNKPAEYSPDNIPYKPKKYFSISLKGVKKDDFTMVYGYPGRTSEYLTSFAVEMVSQVENPHQIKLRGEKLNIMRLDMESSDEIRIKYASKYAGVSNYWKKWLGENRGLHKLNAIEKKKQLENDFIAWTSSNETRKKTYSNLLPSYEKIYKQITPYTLAMDYIYEAAYAIEIIRFARKFNKLAKNVWYDERDTTTLQNIDKQIENLKKATKGFFKNYNLPTDKKIFAALLQMYYNNLEKQFQPEIFSYIEKKFNGNFNKYTEYLFSKSFLTDESKVNDFLNNYSTSSIKKLINDPAFKLFQSIYELEKIIIRPEYFRLNDELNNLNRTYIQGLREMQKEKIFYPDANSTLRIAYGKVDDYFPRDGVHYDYFTTLKGIIEKDNPEIYDYKVPEKLKELYNNKNYGPYGEDGVMKVCFTASNHTTGGNSGSPVIDAYGHLIGINFDRNWEGTMSDIMYDPEQCRNISLDIRYALFIIDKFAGAKHLIDEMILVF